MCSHLFTGYVIPVMNIVMLEKICGNLTDFCVELEVDMSLIGEQDGILMGKKTNKDTQMKTN